jgi:hypothetical protein
MKSIEFRIGYSWNIAGVVCLSSAKQATGKKSSIPQKLLFQCLSIAHFDQGKRRKTEKCYFWFTMPVDKERWPDPRLNLAASR